MSKKRSHGEGSIYRRKDSRWVAQVTLQGRQLYKYFHTQFEAREWLQETQNQIRGGLTLAAAQITVDEFLREWLDANKASLRPKTFFQYEQVFQQYLSPGIGRVKLKELSPSVIQALYNTNLRSGKSERTVLLVHAVLHSALGQALKWGIINRNPAEAVTHPRPSRTEMQTLTDKQVGALFREVRGSRYEALLWLAITTGLREGEILGLKWSDLDWGTGRLMNSAATSALEGSRPCFQRSQVPSWKASSHAQQKDHSQAEGPPRPPAV